jgi:hypothetical protein
MARQQSNVVSILSTFPAEINHSRICAWETQPMIDLNVDQTGIGFASTDTTA